MQNYSYIKAFEQIPLDVLPPKALRIIQTVVRKYLRMTRGKSATEQARYRDIAHAYLHMRLHQKFGASSRSLIEAAHAKLDELIEETNSQPGPFLRPRYQAP